MMSILIFSLEYMNIALNYYITLHYCWNLDTGAEHTFIQNFLVVRYEDVYK